MLILTLQVHQMINIDFINYRGVRETRDVTGQALLDCLMIHYDSSNTSLMTLLAWLPSLRRINILDEDSDDVRILSINTSGGEMVKIVANRATLRAVMEAVPEQCLIDSHFISIENYTQIYTKAGAYGLYQLKGALANK